MSKHADTPTARSGRDNWGKPGADPPHRRGQWGLRQLKLAGRSVEARSLSWNVEARNDRLAHHCM